MIQEYLFMDNEEFKGEEMPCIDGIHPEIEKIKNSGCIMVKYEVPGENEDSAKILSEINEKIIGEYNPKVLTSDCSAYFNRRLFPLYNEFERKLRKLLYLKSCLNSDEKTNENIKDLEQQDLGKIFTLLFTDDNFVASVRKEINQKSWNFTKSEIEETLHNMEEHTLWKKLIGENESIVLPTTFISVKDYRNDVMHAHNISYKVFKDSQMLIKKINEELDKEIGKAIGQKESGTESDSAKNFNAILFDALVSNRLMEENNKLQEEIRMAKLIYQNHDLMELYKLANSPEMEKFRKNMNAIPDLYNIPILAENNKFVSSDMVEYLEKTKYLLHRMQGIPDFNQMNANGYIPK